MTFKKGDKVFVEFEVLDTCYSSDYMLVKDKSNQTRQFLKSEAQLMPEKVVIPKFVAEWITKKKNEGKTMYQAMAYEVKADVFEYIMDNSEVFARAWLDGYEIEQEQLYTVEVPNPNSKGTNKFYLCKDSNTQKVYLCKGNFNPKKNKNLWLTEPEIKQDFDWAWEWAEPVEE